MCVVTRPNRSGHVTALRSVNRPGLAETGLIKLRSHGELVHSYVVSLLGSAGVMLPIARGLRRLLNQLTHSRVAYSTASKDFHGPRLWVAIAIRSAWPRPGLSLRSAVSTDMHDNERSPKPSRPVQGRGDPQARGHGNPSKPWNTPLSNGSTGSITAASSSRSATITPAEAEQRYDVAMDQLPMAA